MTSHNDWSSTMLSKDEIIKKLNDDNNFVDSFILDAFIKNWKIEAIYENENGVEFYDEAAFEKIKNALASKHETPNDITKVEVIHKEPEEPQMVEVEAPEVSTYVEEQVELQVVSQQFQPTAEIVPVKQDTDLKNVTIDITSQTLSVLAQSIAEKISGDISEYLKNNIQMDEAFEAGSYKKDNEVIASKLKEVLFDNKILIKRIQELEAENSSYVKVFGNIYVKKPSPKQK